MVARRTATWREVVGLEDKRRVALRMETLSLRMPTKFLILSGLPIVFREQSEPNLERGKRGRVLFYFFVIFRSL